MRKKRRKSKLIISFILIVYIGFFIRWAYDRGVPTDLIKYGNIDYSVKAEGLILRDEICYSLDFTGRYIPTLAEGAKAAKDSEIAVAMREEVLSLFNQRQIKADELYKIRIKSSENNIGIQMQTLSGTITGLEQELQSLIKLSEKNLTAGISIIQDNIITVINRQYGDYAISTAISPREKVLMDEINVLDSAINKNKASVIASQTGIISYKIDHMERFLQIKDYSTISLKQLDALKKQYNGNQKNEYIIEKNVPFVKIITDFKYRILVETDEDNIERFKKANNIQLRILKTGKTLNATIEYSGKDPDGRNFIVFTLDRALEDLSDSRCLDIVIVINASTGYKVPVSSLFDIQNNSAKIIIVESNFASFKEVSIIGINEEYAIITGTDINLYDIYVIDARNIKEGQVLY